MTESLYLKNFKRIFVKKCGFGCELRLFLAKVQTQDVVFGATSRVIIQHLVGECKRESQDVVLCYCALCLTIIWDILSTTRTVWLG